MFLGLESHGVILGVGKGSASAPEPRGAEMSVLGVPRPQLQGSRCMDAGGQKQVHYAWLQKES